MRYLETEARETWAAGSTLAVDFCNDSSCALLQATDAKLCAQDIFLETDKSPVAAELRSSGLDNVEIYACDFVPQFTMAWKEDECYKSTSRGVTAAACSSFDAIESYKKDEAGAQVCTVDIFIDNEETYQANTCGESNAHMEPRMCPKRYSARTRAKSPNMVRCSQLQCGVAVIMRNMLHPFEFCEGKLGHVWRVHQGKRPIFWVRAQDTALSLEIARVNSRRRSYYPPFVILMLQRFQLERCVDVAEAQSQA